LTFTLFTLQATLLSTGTLRLAVTLPVTVLSVAMLPVSTV